MPYGYQEKTFFNARIPHYVFASAATILGQLFFILPSYAGAWTQKSGDVQLINTLSYYRSDERFDNGGHRISQPDYTKWEWNPYAEYGLNDTTTLGASLYLQRAHAGNASNTGLAESEWFVRKRLWQQNGWVLSLQPKIKLPGIGNDDQPLIGSSHADAALGLQGGYSFTYAGRTHYAEVETEYRYRFGQPRNQYRTNVTLGINASDKITIMPQAFFTWRANDGNRAVFTQSPRDDYDLTTLQLSALYRINEMHQLQLGVFKDIDGRNAGEGEGALIGLWSQF